MADPTSYRAPVPDDFLELDDPVLAAALAARLRERLAGRPAQWEADRPQLADFAGDATLDGLDPAVAEALVRAGALLDAQETGPVLAPSPATALPLLGPIWRRVRGAAHQLVLFYVNRQAARASQVQRQIIVALAAVARDQARQRAALERLEARLQALDAAAPAETTSDDEPL